MLIPIEPLFIVQTLKKAGYDAYIVGGAVRDLLQNNNFSKQLTITDYDLTTDATPEQILSVFPEAFYENTFGTVSITRQDLRAQAGLEMLDAQAHDVVEKKIDVSSATKLHPSLTPTTKEQPQLHNHHPYEITTYRSDGAYSDFRRPEQVTWGSSLEEDLERRDFTINAMALSIAGDALSQLLDTSPLPEVVELRDNEYTIIDPHKGIQGLEWELIQTVGDPHQRFQEDALRMLRAIRFAVQLGFSIDPPTYIAIQNHAELLDHVSGERIRDEFLKMLVSDHPKRAIELLDDTGLLKQFLPELLQAKGVEQAGHHTTDVWEHSLDALEACPSRDPIVKLATLLHDIAKPVTVQQQNGSITFYNHEVIGARMARTIAQRLKLSKRDIDRVFILVRYHMFHYQPEQTDAALRRFMRKVGLENLNDILDLREADRLGSGARKTSWRLEEMKQRMMEQLNQPFDVTDLEVNGDDLIRELGLQPGPVIGRLLTVLLDEVLENPEMNTTEQLIERARAILSQTSSS